MKHVAFCTYTTYSFIQLYIFHLICEYFSYLYNFTQIASILFSSLLIFLFVPHVNACCSNTIISQPEISTVDLNQQFLSAVLWSYFMPFCSNNGLQIFICLSAFLSAPSLHLAQATHKFSWL